ncbi:MAG: spermidine synthase, partial [Candidatus Schekmanbacteria bacterium RBG_16_38_10]
MKFILVGFIYLMFFLSGAAALMYQVLWVRSLSLIFGGSHLAVTAVLSIFMAGLAIGGYIIGKSADSMKKPLRVYGYLELLIGFFAIIFLVLIKLYPYIYIPLAQGRDDNPVYLFLIRIIFSVVVLIVPTSLMGGTLPVLSKFISRHPYDLRNHLSFLYGFNTLGAVAGAIAAGFFFLRFYSVSTTMYIAIVINLLIGFASILLQDRAAEILNNDRKESIVKSKTGKEISRSFTSETKNKNLFPFRLVLWGIGVSGFCALGYEVLWTRILAIVFGASVYGFTTMLAAFLTGIAVGSAAYGVLPKVFNINGNNERVSVVCFGIVQIIIGITSLIVTVYIRDLPLNSMLLQDYFQRFWKEFFKVKIWSNFSLAFLYMFVPAFFMGIAFPLAGKIHAHYRKMVGGAVGEVLAYNTAGAILGAALSGFGMIYLFGIERSLQMLIVINIGFGLFIALSVRNLKIVNWSLPVIVFAVLVFLGVNHDALRIWDTKYFAIFRNNQPEAFDTPEKIEDAVKNTDVLYYVEGVESIVSSIKVKGGYQSFLTNGRVEAATSMEGQQCQYMLGHLPMLLTRDPKKVLVIGTGSGMTLGAISVHHGVEEITLVEIEPKVIGVARTFGNYNHHVFDNPKLKIIFNDGRNFLMTTRNSYDVITADPIHPWFRGAGYLYTSEYFKLASGHLAPGGIMC